VGVTDEAQARAMYLNFINNNVINISWDNV
jgi:hypothetical protein